MDTAQLMPEDSATLSAPLARDTRVPEGPDQNNVGLLTATDDSPIPDVTPLLQSGQLAKATTVLRQCLATAPVDQQYHIYFLLADIALASGNTAALNDAYDHVIQICKPEEVDPIERLRQKDLEEIAARNSTAPVEVPVPAATSPANAASDSVNGRDDSQPYPLENRANEHKEDVEEHASHVIALAKLIQAPSTPLEEAMAAAEQAAQGLEQAFQALEKTRGTVQTLQYMLEDYPGSRKVKRSLDRATHYLQDAEAAYQAAADAENALTGTLTDKQKTAVPAPPATNHQESLPQTPTVKPDDRPTNQSRPVPDPLTDARPQSPPVSQTAGPPSAEDLAWANAILERFQRNDPTLTQAEIDRYNAIATRTWQNQGPPADVEVPKSNSGPQIKTDQKPHHGAPTQNGKPLQPQKLPVPNTIPADPVAANREEQPVPAASSGAPTGAELAWADTVFKRFQLDDPTLTDAERSRYNDIATRYNNHLAAMHKAVPPVISQATKPVTPGQVLKADPPAEVKPSASKPTGDLQAAAADHEKQYLALAPRVEELQRRRSALNRREMAATALGLVNARAAELVRQRTDWEQDRARLVEEARSADQAFLSRLAELQAIQKAEDMDRFITARARKVRQSLLGQ